MIFINVSPMFQNINVTVIFTVLCETTLKIIVKLMLSLVLLIFFSALPPPHSPAAVPSPPVSNQNLIGSPSHGREEGSQGNSNVTPHLGPKYKKS